MRSALHSSRWMLLTALLGLLPAASARADGSVGKKIDGFALKDTTGKIWALADLKDKKAVVVLFLGTECPINNAFMPRLTELHEKYSDKSVQFLALNPNRQDTPDKIVGHVREHKIPFPVLRDTNSLIADAFGARRTPEAFILDAGRVIRYHGRIDDQFGLGFTRPVPTRHDLAVALDEVLAGKKVSQATTPVAGCLIGRAPRPKDNASITYTKHISRIVQNRCQECHRPGQIGPM